MISEHETGYDDGQVADGEPSPDEGGGQDSPVAGSSAGGEVEVRLQELQQELESLQDRHLRLAAEFDNYRKRVNRERSDLWSQAQADLVKQLLDVFDDLQRFVHHDGPTDSGEAVLDGVRLVEKKLRQALEAAGLECVEAEGEQFDPVIMEAVLTVPAESPEEDGLIAMVLQRGYRFKDLLLRPSKVQVKQHQD